MIIYFNCCSCVSFRQCLCCFKEYKHLEVFNQLVYALINLVIAQISSLRDRLCTFHGLPHKEPETEWDQGDPALSLPRPSSPGEDEPVNVERDSAEEDEPNSSQDKSRDGGQEQQTSEAQTEASGAGESGGTLKAEAEGDGAGEGNTDDNNTQDLFSAWSTEEREKLLLCAAKIFQIQFPLYTAYKHNTHPTIEVRTQHCTRQVPVF